MYSTKVHTHGTIINLDAHVYNVVVMPNIESPLLVSPISRGRILRWNIWNTWLSSPHILVARGSPEPIDSYCFKWKFVCYLVRLCFAILYV